ncbi:MAG: phosphate ABC transporter permease subunit PstC [Bacillota bacterium]|nr:phosphate ABC transporter permease subunit PstC [Bacillota bacterium]
MPDKTRFSSKQRKRRQAVDRTMRGVFLFCGILSALMILLIFYFVGQKGIQVFLPSYGEKRQNLWNFLTGMSWRQDRGVYGVGFIVINTLITSFGAAVISFPLAVLTGLYIVKLAPKRMRVVFTTVIELLAAIPSVVYGVFASGSITGLVNTIAGWFGQITAGGVGSLSVIFLLAIMIFPTICSMSIVSIAAVDRQLELGSLALGATPMQTNMKVVLTAARSGIFAGLILGLGRAFGEATAVTMVAGNAMIGPTINPFDPTRTLTSTMLAGLKETTGLDYDIRFSAGIVLMIIIVGSNLLIHQIRRRIGGVTNE